MRGGGGDTVFVICHLSYSELKKEQAVNSHPVSVENGILIHTEMFVYHLYLQLKRESKRKRNLGRNICTYAHMFSTLRHFKFKLLCSLLRIKMFNYD